MAAETVLILGGGGREHALAFKLSQTESKSQTRKVWVCPGNAGIALSFECIAPEGEGIEGLVALAKRLKPDLVIVGPEEPLAHGIVDALEREGLCVFGPSKACAQLEASKSFMKEICALAKVATARSQTFSDLASLEIYLSDKPGRHVVKADGLCAGKGVTLCENAHQTLQVAQNYLGAHGAPRFGESSQKIIVEEFLSGKEVSVIGICDGDNAMLFAPVRDHKRLLDGDLGPNTGGMGVVGPITMADDNNQFLARVRREIFLPTLKAMKDRIFVRGPYG
jgi:phosphoribosylamine--glycine ligase